jgi:hypothetical protein
MTDFITATMALAATCLHQGSLWQPPSQAKAIDAPAPAAHESAANRHSMADVGELRHETL